MKKVKKNYIITFLSFNIYIYLFFKLDAGSVTYVHDWKTIDLAGLPLTKNGNAVIGKLLLETQADRILYIEIENPQDLDDFGPIFASF